MIYRYGLVGAVQGRVDENLTVLDERSVDKEAGTGKGIQSVQVDVGDDGGDDAAEKVYHEATVLGGSRIRITGERHGGEVLYPRRVFGRRLAALVLIGAVVNGQAVAIEPNPIHAGVQVLLSQRLGSALVIITVS
ncbi:unnamed protein product [Clonostachys rosea]|uniref:Uncharacterized protein n=1 Tax=Bionectria ochroleuca TaxID=29856 RepID=A0ABY6UXT5_BIOOC|nr:unnamed protein product [Clonostachys rosea]